MCTEIVTIIMAEFCAPSSSSVGLEYEYLLRDKIDELKIPFLGKRYLNISITI